MKYPRTPHLPWSPGATSDDVRLQQHAFDGAEVVVTEKLDGENTTLLPDRMHARSEDSAHHPSRTRVKALHARIAASLAPDERICGENVAARHSLPYTDLLGWFYAFSVWRGERCLDWDATVSFAHDRGLPTPRVLYRGPWNPGRIRKLAVPRERVEGYVVRTVQGFGYGDFGAHVAKWVRPNHVQTDQHWMQAPVVWNQLAPEAVLWTCKSGGTVHAQALRDWLGADGIALGEHAPYDRGGLGEARLEGLIASQLVDRPTGPLLPRLVGVLGMERAVRIVHLLRLHEHLKRPVDDATREGGLVSLARATDLRVLHGLATHRWPDDEQVAWSRLHAEHAGLWARDPLQSFRAAIEAAVASEDAVWAVSEALTARAAGKLRSPEEALAWLHPRLGRPRRLLTVLVGPSGSGKSTWAKGGVVVSLDALRDGFDRRRERQILAEALDRVAQLLPTTDVTWDATSLQPSQRALPLRLATDAETRIVAVVTTPERAAARNARRRRPVPPAVVQAQWGRLRWPLPHEAHRVEWVDANE